MKLKAYRFTPVGKLAAADDVLAPPGDWFIECDGVIIAQLDSYNTVIYLGHGHCYINFVDERLEEFDMDFSLVRFDPKRFERFFKSWYPEIELANELLQELVKG
jgi:hypothetical protein